jgi:hypothetical protein
MTGHQLESLEQSMWRAETRFDAAYMKQVLAPEFLEFGRSGSVYDRQASISMQASDFRARLHDLAVHPLGDDVALVTYVSEVTRAEAEPELSNRASVWVRTDGRWRLRFHQGTSRPR